MINTVGVGLVSSFKESYFHSQAVDVKNKISELGRNSLETLSQNKTKLILAGGLLTVGAIYSSKLLSCMQEQEDSSDLIGQCHGQIIADGVNETLAFAAAATSILTGLSQYLAIRRQTTV